MSKHRKPAQKQSAVRSLQSAVPEAPLEIPPFFKNSLLQSALIFAFAFLLYANTLTHSFTLDDAIVITDNMFTKQGVEGIPGILSKDTFFGYFKVEGKEALVSGGRYRPLTLVLFAFMYQLFGENSFVFHLLTVLLFAATCVVLYRTLLLLFRTRFGEEYGAMLSWMAAVLFAAHPIHTEVVANVKGCDEIVTLLGSLGALFFTLKAFDTQKFGWSLAAGLTFFLACLSKENAVTFLVVIPLALWFFRDPLPQAMPSSAGVVRTCIPIFVAFIAFFLLRGNILEWRFGGTPMEFMNNPFLKIQGDKWVPYTASEKLATVCYTLWKYVQLLFVPHPLTHDYYPRHIGMMTFANPVALLGFVFHIFLAGYALTGIRRRDPVRFGILFYLLTISIVSNLVFPVGTIMGERFAFMPSVGFCIVAAALLLRFFGKKPVVALGILGVVSALFALKTVSRNPVWANNEKLFFADVATSANSAKIRNACGGVLFDKAVKEKNTVKQTEICQMALLHLDAAIKIYPNYKDAYMSRGGCNYLLKNYDNAVEDYRQALRLAEGDAKIKNALALVLRDAGKYYGEQKGDVLNAFRLLTESWQYNTKDAETARLLGVANGIQGKHPDAVMWFEKSVALAPDNATYWFDLSMAYRAAGNPAKSEEAIRKAVEINPNILEERNQKK